MNFLSVICASEILNPVGVSVSDANSCGSRILVSGGGRCRSQEGAKCPAFYWYSFTVCLRERWQPAHSPWIYLWSFYLPQVIISARRRRIQSLSFDGSMWPVAVACRICANRQQTKSAANLEPPTFFVVHYHHSVVNCRRINAPLSSR